MKYEFNVGDEVKTINGRIGHVAQLTETTNAHNICNSMVIEFENGDSLSGTYNNIGMFIDYYYYKYEDFFKRIGKYDFTKIENKIKPLNFVRDVEDANIVDLRCKINEIIDYINRSDVSKVE